MTGSEAVADTTFAVAVLNDDPAAVTLVRTFSVLHVPVTVVAELLYGARNSGNVAANTARVHAFLSRSRVVDLTTATATAYAEIAFSLRRKGKPIPQNDIWIAAVAQSLGLPLVTLDHHFSVVDNLSRIRP